MTEMTEVLPDAVKDAAKNIIPMKRFGKPEEIADMIHTGAMTFLKTEYKYLAVFIAFVFVGGSTFVVAEIL